MHGTLALRLYDESISVISSLTSMRQDTVICTPYTTLHSHQYIDLLTISYGGTLERGVIWPPWAFAIACLSGVNSLDLPTRTTRLSECRPHTLCVPNPPTFSGIDNCLLTFFLRDR